MMEKIKIGSYQGRIVTGNIEKNIEKVIEIFSEAKKENLHFLCFPETYLSGYTPESIKNCAVYIDDERIKNLILETNGSQIVLIVGMSEKIVGKEGIYNTALVIQNGKLLGKAHKTMLTGFDKENFVTDLDLPVFEVFGVKFGICICHTTSFVEPAQYLRLKGARLLFAPHYNSLKPTWETPSGFTFSYWGHRQMVLNNQVAIATLLKMVVVRSNIINADENGLGSGDSNIWGIDGELIASGTPFLEQLVTAEIDKEIFLREHILIDKKEVPFELYNMINQAAKEYYNN